MVELSHQLLGATPFMPHGHCYLWKTGLVGLHVASDSLIALAYYSIPVILICFVRQREDLPFPKVFWLFGAFIIACGTTHFMEVWTLWNPDYWLSGIIKAITAIVSLYTALELIPIIPQALALPSPAKLEAINRELEKEILERQKIEEALKAYMEQLETSNRQLEEFAYVASHDLQEPLRKILTFGDRLKTKCDTTLNEQAGDYLERMQNAAKRMQILINDLLTLSRINTPTSGMKTVNLATIISEVKGDLEVRIEQLNAKLEIGELPTLEADPTQMRQLLQNLIDNALKFTPPGGKPHIKIYSHPYKNPDGNFSEIEEYWQIFVQDNGIGFDEKYLEKIFIPFQRLHARSEYTGTGIGLAICRKIAERHNGTITAKSSPTEGSTFIITLPINQTKKGQLT
ncbi:ATP-binding protein [Ancylothrix sp. C2]|uniref:sensor histidine kinase n=1 Tax=Ancylothrix sp. D3o TaxID=2953691 RepID=UPI0021BB0A17|nr:ATP-binding protein [Ancylothrix sp. D3o]MCT7952404.1 ATP-binding protein [Ancylothrix sp. D3o]